MANPAVARVVDIGMFVLANLANLLLVGASVSRLRKAEDLELNLETAFVLLALPTAGAVVFNAWYARPWWTVVLPVPLVAVCAALVLFDYILAVDWRQGMVIGPMLGAFSVSLVALVGYALGVREAFGLLTLGTYLVQLGATWYSFLLAGQS